MGFSCKYPLGYHGDIAIIDLWFMERCSMDKQVRDNLAFGFGRRHKPKRYVSMSEIQNNPDLYLVDYTSLSCVTLNTKKNRYLLNDDGYFVLGLLVAKNVVSNRKYAMFVGGTQIAEKPLRLFRELIKRELGTRNVTFVTDNRHNVSLITTKKNSMWIEVEFAGLKTVLYRKLRPYQHYRNNKIHTDITIKELVQLYIERLKKCNIKLLASKRINQLTNQQII